MSQDVAKQRLAFARAVNWLQGNRVKESCRDEAGQEVVVPRGDFALEAEAVLAGRPADQVEGHVLDGGEIGGSVIGPNAALVIAEDHVHNPMQAVFDGPMCTNDRSELGGPPR